MDNTVLCMGDFCSTRINLSKDVYGRDFYIIVNLTQVEEFEMQSREDIVNNGHVEFYCKDCGVVHMAEAAANGFEIMSRREGNYL